MCHASGAFPPEPLVEEVSELTAPRWGGVRRSGAQRLRASESALGAQTGLGEQGLGPPHRPVPVPWGACSTLLAFWKPQGKRGWVASKVAAIFVEICQFLAGSLPQLQQLTDSREQDSTVS